MRFHLPRIVCLVLAAALIGGLTPELFAGKKAGSLTFEVYKDRGGKYRFRIKNQKGTLLANTRKGFKTEAAITQVIDTIKKSANKATIVDEGKKATASAMAYFEVYKDRGGKYRFRLKDKNNSLLASATRGYKTKAEIMAVMQSIQQHAAAAKVIMKK